MRKNGEAKKEMITIVVTPARPLIHLLYRVLSRAFEVLCVKSGEILLPDMAPEILLVEANHPPECDGDVIYLLGGKREGYACETFSGNPRAVAITDSQNAQTLRFAADHHLKTLTCGLSGKDTLTLSSIGENDAVVCLQREIATIGGGMMDPAEIPVRLREPLERIELLELAAALLLCGAGELLSEPF